MEPGTVVEPKSAIVAVGVVTAFVGNCILMVGVTDPAPAWVVMALGVAVNNPTAGVPLSASAEAVARFCTSVMLVACPSGVENRLLELIGVLVTLGGVEYGWLHAEAMIANNTSIDATIALRFILAMAISSIPSKSFNDSSTSHLTRQVTGWEF